MPRQLLISDLEKRLGTPCINDWIDAEAQLLAGADQPVAGYVDLTQSIFSARSIEGAEPMGIRADARIIPVRNKYRIEYRRDLPISVRRLAIAHEIGHTYWFKPGGGAHPISPLQVNPSYSPEIEILCDRFAASLLLPDKLFNIKLSEVRQRPDIISAALDKLPEIASHQNVPERIVAERILSILKEDISIIFCIRYNNTKPQLLFEHRTEESNCWQLSWCAVPQENKMTLLPSDLCLPGADKSWKPRVPLEMVPEWATINSKKGAIDGRWDALRTVQPREAARMPFRTRKAEPELDGFARRVNDKIYISLLSK